MIFLFMCFLACDHRQLPADTPVPVLVQEVDVNDISQQRKILGHIVARERVPVSFAVGGRVEKLFVEKGDFVTKNTHLAMLEHTDYKLQADLANAEFSAIQPSLDRAHSLFNQDALTHAELDKIQAKADIAAIKKIQAENKLSYVNLYAPIEGAVLDVMVGPGDLVGPQRPALEMAIMDPLDFVVQVAQQDIDLFPVGTEITLSADGLEGNFKGIIARIGYLIDVKTRTFPVVITVPNPDKRLKLGMIMEATIITNKKQGIILELSNITTSTTGEHIAYVVEDNIAKSRIVALGSLYGSKVEIEKGLNPGDRVIVQGNVTEGQQVYEVKK